MMVEVLVAMLLCVVLLETYFRLFPSAIDYNFRYKVKSDQYVPKNKGKGTKYSIVYQNHPWHEIPTVEIQLNNYGFRGTDILSKERKEKRVFLMGASFFADFFHSYANCLGIKIEKSIQEKSTGGIKVSVQSTPVGGEIWEDVMAQLINRVVQLEPDVVIYAPPIKEFGNQIGLRFSQGGNTAECFTLEYRTEWQNWKTLISCILSQFSLWSHAAILVAKLMGIPLPGYIKKGIRYTILDVGSLFKKQTLHDTNELLQSAIEWEKARTHLMMIHSICKSAGIKFLFVLPCTRWGAEEGDFTHISSVTNKSFSSPLLQKLYEKYSHYMENICKEEKIPFCNLNLEYPKNKMAWVDDLHLWDTTKAAEKIADSVIQNNLL